MNEVQGGADSFSVLSIDNSQRRNVVVAFTTERPCNFFFFFFNFYN